MIKHNYHAHTKYCKHSEYSAEQLIQRSIKYGLETLGFSEHIHLESEKGRFRLTDEDAFNEYVDELKVLREKYKNQIRILIGLESEIVDPNTGKSLKNWINKYAKHKDVDYIILGHHTYSNGTHVFYEPPTQELLDDYVNRFVEAVSETEILYVGHPDGFLKGTGQWTDEYRAAARKMIKAAVKYDKPLGLNLNGFSYGVDFCYPDLEYFKIAAEEGAKVIFELDAHSESPFTEESWKRAKAIADEAGVKIVEKLI